MAIIINIDVMMAKRKMSLNELSERVNITQANMSILKTGKAKAIRISTLERYAAFWSASPATSSNTARTNRTRSNRRRGSAPADSSDTR